MPGLVGGGADLTGNTGTKLLAAAGVIGTHDFRGRQIHFGIREHGMGAVMNGMFAGGLLPFGGTFFVFSDYMRGAVRVAALSGYKVAFVWSHDSIGVGEDGPTHQPVEQLAAMRAMPGIRVIRPADANETVEAWRIHLENEGPTAIILTRQKVPVLETTADRAERGVARGAYVLIDEDPAGPDIVLIGTGSEVQLCVGAHETLSARGVSVRVVSMPCWELFAALPEEEQAEVLPPGVLTLAVEAAATFGWERYADDTIGIDHFGASAPGDVTMREFGFTVENVVAHAAASARTRGGRMTSSIARLNDFGQSPWYDNVTRTMVRGGGLQQLIDEDGIRGVTSNPTIFDKAIGGGEGYDGQLADLHQQGVGAEDAFWALAVDDIGGGADLLRPIYDRLDRGDGFISIEVSPLLAHDTKATIEQAASLFKRLGRPNVLIKIPATLEGIPAIEETIAAGINVNVTLIFSLDRHEAVIEAYLKGLERLVAGGGDPAGVSSVASFFVSRVDTETDQPPPRGLAPAGQGRGRQREAGVRLVPGAVHRDPLGCARRRRGRSSSDRCGRRRPRRTRPTPPRCTWTRWSARTRSTRSRPRRSTRCMRETRTCAPNTVAEDVDGAR